MITIDLSKFVPPAAFEALPTIVREVLPDLVERARTEIIRLAGERLTTSFDDYVAGLQPARVTLTGGGLPDTGVVAVIELVGWLPNAIEAGWAGGDMKPALLHGRNAKQGKDGPYNIVPLRQFTPGTSGRHGTEMGQQFAVGFRVSPSGFEQTGSMGKDAARKLGRRIHKAAKALSPTTSHPGGGTSWGSRLPAGLAPVLREHHRTDPFAGMVRQEKTYKNATQSQYTTFRAVSVNSDPRAWIHPGIEGHRLFEAAGPRIESDAGTLFSLAVAELGDRR